MRQRWRPVRDEQGQGVVVLLVVAVVVLVTVFFLSRTVYIGRRINTKASKIAETGRGINTATDAILQLDTTTGLGQSIKNSTEPLEGKSNIIVGQAASIDGTASSINNSANSINSSANGINGAVSSIQGLARLVDRDAQFINDNVRSAITTGADIHGDLGSVIGALAHTENNADRIEGVLCGVLFLFCS